MLSSVLEGCGSSKIIAGTIVNSDLVVPEMDFQQGNSSFKKYIVVQHDQLKYPVCVFRFSDTDYSAVLMRCTHQGLSLIHI